GERTKTLKQGPIRIAAPIFKLWISSGLEAATATKGRKVKGGGRTGVQIIGLARPHGPLCATTGGPRQVLLFLPSPWGAPVSFCHPSSYLFRSQGMFGDSHHYLPSSVPYRFLSVVFPQGCLAFSFPFP
ncbi:uncharacterized protein BO80DRAFT_342523, partial [Aspergillus ibericus CBS 121593]